MLADAGDLHGAGHDDARRPPRPQPHRRAPAPHTRDRGRQWQGYISDQHVFTPGGSASFLSSFGRPAPPDGSPRPKNTSLPFIAGARLSGDATVGPATRPVFCGATSADLGGYGDNTVCRDGSFSTSTNQNRDLALTPGAPVPATPGSTVPVP